MKWCPEEDTYVGHKSPKNNVMLFLLFSMAPILAPKGPRFVTVGRELGRAIVSCNFAKYHSAELLEALQRYIEGAQLGYRRAATMLAVSGLGARDGTTKC